MNQIKNKSGAVIWDESKAGRMLEGVFYSYVRIIIICQTAKLNIGVQENMDEKEASNV